MLCHILAYSGTSGSFSNIEKRYLMVSKKNNPLFVSGWDRKNPSLGIIVCHHLASLVMPNGDPQDGFFYATLTLMIDSYNLTEISVCISEVCHRYERYI